MEQQNQFNFFKRKKQSLVKSTGKASAYVMWEISKSVTVTGALVCVIGCSFMVFDSFRNTNSSDNTIYFKQAQLENARVEKEKITEKKNTQEFYQYIYGLSDKNKSEILASLHDYPWVKFGLETKNSVSVTLVQQFKGFSSYETLLLEFDKDKLTHIYIKYPNDTARQIFQQDHTILSEISGLTEGYQSYNALRVEFKDIHAKR